ncbi:AIPR family protein [Cobetia marina]|uniref:AIPR family protein n=1 Tax=Cobetia marina TaxID=28258 RepID=UPI00254914E2|nr:AIPR family protein [Cobetia pacifica]MDI6003069.1 AIPR family protein [Cobetia pacifica]
MSKNSQVLLDAIIKQEMQNLDVSNNISEFFEFYSALQILKDYELSYDEIYSGIAGKSHDGGVDSIYLFINGELIKEDKDEDFQNSIISKYKKNIDIELVLIQSKYEDSFGEPALLKISRLCRNLFNLEFSREDFEGRYNNKVLSSFALFKKTYLGLITKRPKLKINIHYVSKGIDVHPNVRLQADDLEADVAEKLTGSTVKVAFTGADDLVKISQSHVNNVFQLKLSEAPISTSNQVFIALTNLSEYFNFITDKDNNLIKHIFESNVRDYQGKTNVNSEIQDTLKNPRREEFWWLNNGVTVLASEITAPGGKELVIHNPEIVNGLQTSSEIYRYYSNNPDKIAEEKRDILVRVMVPEDEETRDRIIRATNSQTPIPKSSLRATDPIHRQIEDYLKPRGLYYDRRKNFYKNEGKKPKEIIGVPFISQCLMSTLMQKPDFARARPSTLLENDEAYSKLFHKNNDLNTYLMVASWGRQVEQYLKELKTFNATEITDIKFYVLYHSTCIITNSLYPSNSQINKKQENSLTPKILADSTNTIHQLYKYLGGNDKVAKGPKLKEATIKKLKEDNNL